ncbi:PseG/SpsG family protein [Bacillus pumilus]|uniref:PseG/SpsG family protein n=1 Tax=Bacillus pumilus TaxID=1408 RepID=UPI0011E92017|nr:glycosyltransferase [Bacillus pumilus]TYS33005.1 spore coat protein [Bacillus pumilus]TYS50708.1 spore coat protein [Bacillus pumilus]
MNKKIMIVVYGGFLRGMGHVVRMKRLAKELVQEGNDLYFYTNEQMCVEMLSHPEWHVHLVQESNVSLQMEQDIKELHPDLLLVDILDCDLQFLRSIKSSSRYTKLVLFEEERAEACQLADAVVNGIYGGLDEKHLQVNGTDYFYGTPYLLLDHEISKLKDTYEVRKECKKVVVSLGGSDPGGLLLKVVSSLLEARHLHILAVAGKASRVEEQIEAAHIQFIRHTDQLPAHLAEADLAIVAGGMTLYEAVCIGVPSIVLSQVDHQAMTAARFAQNGACHHLGLGDLVDEKDIWCAARRLSGSYFLRRSIHLNGRSLIDGKGTERVKNILIHLMNHHQKEHKDV